MKLTDVNLAPGVPAAQHEPPRVRGASRTGGSLRHRDGWLAHPCSTVVHPTERHAAVLRELLEPLGTAGNLTTDAHLAALAIEHGADLCSSDSDFSRFPGIR